MEHVVCNLCNRNETQLLFKKRDKFHIVEDEFTVVGCRGCGLFYVNPRPTREEMVSFYPETYSWRETLNAGSFLAKWVRRLEKGYRYHLLKDEVSRVIKFTGKRGGKVLDIGCGTGDRLDAFRVAGFETCGVETSEAANYAKEHLGLNVIKGDLFTAHFPGGFFDIITLYNVLEHTHDPKCVIIECHRILKKEGFLIIQIPNKDCFQFRIFKERWAAFDVPRDLYYFGTKTISSLLEEGGFNVVKIDYFMNWWHPPTLVISLFPNLDPQKAWLAEDSGGDPLFQRAAWILATLLAPPFTHLESLTGHGALMTVYARRMPC